MPPRTYHQPVSRQKMPRAPPQLFSALLQEGPGRRSVALVISVLFGILADIISKENEKERDHRLNDDWYRASSPGIAVCGARIHPCRRAKCYGTGQYINHRSQRFYSQNRSEEENANSEQHCAEKPEVSIQKQGGRSSVQ